MANRIFQTALLCMGLTALMIQVNPLQAQPTYKEVVKPTTPENDAKSNSDAVPKVIPIPGKIDSIVILRFKFDTDLLQGMEESVAEQGIQNAIILSGIGSVRNYHIHVVSNSVFPSKNIYIKDTDAPADLCSINGYVMDGRVHAHVTLSTEEEAFGGHLEHGTSVFTFAIVTLGILDEDQDISWVDDKTFR